MRLVQGFGGKCCNCGYSKCTSALEFHHLDNDKKDFTFSDYRDTANWNKIKTEIIKCAMVCANCHREVHEGIIELSPIPFDESLIDESLFTDKRFRVSDNVIIDGINSGFSMRRIAIDNNVTVETIRKRCKKLEIKSVFA